MRGGEVGLPVGVVSGWAGQVGLLMISRLGWGVRTCFLCIDFAT
jgi:hypothetical protein